MAAETKWKGLWYFDQNALPRDNLANPYNLEPKFQGHATDSPVWDATLNRWTVFDGKKMVLEIGNFLDYRPTELLRGICLAIDLRLISPPGSLVMSTSTDEVLIAQLTSDIQIGLIFRGSDMKVYLAYRTIANTWQKIVSNSDYLHTILVLNQDRVYLMCFNRSISDPRHMTLSMSSHWGLPHGPWNSIFSYPGKISIID